MHVYGPTETTTFASWHEVKSVAEEASTAKRVDVLPLETAGQSQRVEPASAGSLKPGDKVIVGGAHYVVDGEEVSLVEELETIP